MLNTTNPSSPSPSKPVKSPSTSSSSTRRPKRGKSRFAKKQHGKKPVAPVKPKTPVNTYTSVCCGLPAAKPRAFSTVLGGKDKTGLGKWRCSGCRKVCKVTVSKYKTPDAATEAAAILVGSLVPEV